MIYLGCDPGFRHYGVVVAAFAGKKLDHLVLNATLVNGPLSKWETGVPALLDALGSSMASARVDMAGVEKIEWYGKRKGVMALAHLAGATYGYLNALNIPVKFFPPKSVKEMSRRHAGEVPNLDEHQNDALSICRLLAAKA